VSTLDQKVVLITGAKGGLGTFVTRAFLEAGATVVGVSRSIVPSDFAHPRFIATPAELSSEEAAHSLVNRTVADLGKIDALVHLVGGYAGGKTVHDTDADTLARMLDLNLWSAFRMIRAVIPHMLKQGEGRILAVGSRAAMEPSPMAGAYSASKAALVALIRAVAAENSDKCISANIVLPGTMDTPANRTADPQADFTRWVQPSQVAGLLVHLASANGSQINGAAIPVYGREV
jgi:NAD(P)-dependent dehydrogenase (short-subunit alcohol dehydrogenase family)